MFAEAFEVGNLVVLMLAVGRNPDPDRRLCAHLNWTLVQFTSKLKADRPVNTGDSARRNRLSPIHSQIGALRRLLVSDDSSASTAGEVTASSQMKQSPNVGQRTVATRPERERRWVLAYVAGSPERTRDGLNPLTIR